MTDDPMGDVLGDASNLTPVPPTPYAPPRTASSEGVSAREGLQAKEEAQDREIMTSPSHMIHDLMGDVSGEASDPTPLPLTPDARTPTGSPTGNAAGEDPGALTARIDHLPLAFTGIHATVRTKRPAFGGWHWGGCVAGPWPVSANQ